LAEENRESLEDPNEGSNADTNNESVDDDSALFNLIQHILKCHIKENKELQN